MTENVRLYPGASSGGLPPGPGSQGRRDPKCWRLEGSPVRTRERGRVPEFRAVVAPLPGQRSGRGLGGHMATAGELKEENLCPIPAQPSSIRTSGRAGDCGSAGASRGAGPRAALSTGTRGCVRLPARGLVGAGESSAHTHVKVPANCKVAIADRQTHEHPCGQGSSRGVGACGRSRVQEAITAVLPRRPRLWDSGMAPSFLIFFLFSPLCVSVQMCEK